MIVVILEAGVIGLVFGAEVVAVVDPVLRLPAIMVLDVGGVPAVQLRKPVDAGMDQVGQPPQGNVDQVGLSVGDAFG